MFAIAPARALRSGVMVDFRESDTLVRMSDTSGGAPMSLRPWRTDSTPDVTADATLIRSPARATITRIAARRIRAAPATNVMAAAAGRGRPRFRSRIAAGARAAANTRDTRTAVVETGTSVITSAITTTIPAVASTRQPTAAARISHSGTRAGAGGTGSSGFGLDIRTATPPARGTPRR